MEKYLDDLIADMKKYTNEGSLADYIPELKKANVEDIAVSISRANRTYSAGESDKLFTIQSISKVISLLIALEEYGPDYVFSKLASEGSKDPFNSIYELDLTDGKPSNPMINSGAILVSSLISKKGGVDKVLELIERIIGRTPSYNKEVYQSEKDTGSRNKAIAYLLHSKGQVENPDITLENYFKQCSIELSARDLSKLAYFLSTGKAKDPSLKVDRMNIRRVLAIMSIAGMYNYSGRFAMEIGLPSKSGVGGGIISCCPDKLGIGVYSPGLDVNGNSLIGIKLIERISKDLNLSIY